MSEIDTKAIRERAEYVLTRFGDWQESNRKIHQIVSDDVPALCDRVDKLEAMLALTRAAYKRGADRFRAAHPEYVERLMWPDTGVLMEWLLEQLDSAAKSADEVRLAPKGLWMHPVSGKPTGEPRAHEHHRTRPGFCPEAAGVGAANGMGLATVPEMRRNTDVQERGAVGAPHLS